MCQSNVFVQILAVLSGVQCFTPTHRGTTYRGSSISSRLFVGNEKLRFWSQIVKIPRNSTSGDLTDTLTTALSQEGIDISKINTGMFVVPFKREIVPINDGMLQMQHQQSYGSNGDVQIEDKYHDAILCAFSPRASHNVVNPSEEERPIDIKRLEALDTALEYYGIKKEELLTDSMAGTPAVRAYRSFISPRPQAIHILEPIGRAANRTAAQIELALRQVRADQAAYYLRNTDKALQSGRKTFPMVLVLDNIRSAFNVGSMFRTAETGGISELITIGITAHPPHPKLRKTAFSSIDVVPSRHFDDIMDAILDLKRQGYFIVALETTFKSQVYSEIKYPEKVALIVGNEVTGVDTRVMDVADAIAEIPTYGIKNSLNVASAAPVVLFEVLRQWSNSKSNQ